MRLLLMYCIVSPAFLRGSGSWATAAGVGAACVAVALVFDTVVAMMTAIAVGITLVCMSDRKSGDIY